MAGDLNLPEVPTLVYQIADAKLPLPIPPHRIVSYRGCQTEDSSKIVWVNVWHKFHEGGASQQADPLESLAEAAQKPEIYHVKIPTELDVAKSLSAPCTEIAHMTVNPGQSVDELLDLMDQLSAAFRRGEGFHAMHRAPTHENPNLVAGFLGWDSKEAHEKAVKPDTEAYAIIQKMLAIGPITGYHVSLTATDH